MNKEEAIEKSLELIKNSKIAIIGTIDESGYPNIKAMMNLKSEGIKKIWFSTNTSSKRIKQIIMNKKTCVYYHTNEDYMGLMLIVKTEILNDLKSKKMLWYEGCEKYYPKGINDADYSVLCFTAEKTNLYHRLENISFKVD